MTCDCDRGEGVEWYHALKCPVARALRNCWCTPLWLAELIGTVSVDPCSNERSRVLSLHRLTEADDGLRAAVNPSFTYFINPPYGFNLVIQWVRHYLNSRFIFLLRWDPSTAWFAELLPACDYVWFPTKRIDFDPPPHIRSSSNPFPHALYLRRPDEALLTRLKAAGYLFRVDADFLAALNLSHGKRGNGNRESSGAGGQSDSVGDSGGGESRVGGDRSGDDAGPTWTVPDEAASKRYWRRIQAEAWAREAKK